MVTSLTGELSGRVKVIVTVPAVTVRIWKVS
jgi:hypothetical protein